MILINTGIPSTEIDNCIKEIETETFVPVSISQYKKFIYENLSCDSLPSLEFYRYKVSENALSLLFAIQKTKKSVLSDKETLVSDLNIPDIEFLYAQRTVADISDDYDDIEETTEINIENFEKKSFTETENNDIVYTVENDQDNIDDFEGFLSFDNDTTTTHLDGFTGINDIDTKEEKVSKRSTSDWNNMSSTFIQPKKKAPKNNVSGLNSSALPKQTSANIPTKGVVTETEKVVLQDTLETKITKKSTVEAIPNSSKTSAVDTSPFVFKDIRSYLKQYPNSEISEVLKHFSKKELDRELKLGRIFKKGTILYI